MYEFGCKNQGFTISERIIKQPLRIVSDVSRLWTLIFYTITYLNSFMFN